jgi:peptidoglycan/xylan/chitin deacetylase (PgdA/CDA1 family)
MTQAIRTASEVIGIGFHGVGTPARGLEAGAAEYFVSRDLFLAVLDIVLDHPEVDLTFDDGYASDVEIALPALLERGLSARYFPLAGRLDTSGHVTRTDLRALAGAGMTIGSHGMHHRSWRDLDPKSGAEELDTARSVLAEAADTPVTEVACPFGAYDRSVLRALSQRGYTRVFTSDRRRARRGDWLQPRYSVRRNDTASTVQQEILAPPGLRQRTRGIVAAQVKAWR